MARRSENLMFAVIAAVGLLLVAGVGAVFVSQLPPVPRLDKVARQGPSAEAMVRTHLRENLNSGKWEEVYWWPEATLTEGGRTRRFIQVRVRSHNFVGALIVNNLRFELRGGKAVPADDEELNPEFVAKAFPPR